MKKTTRLTALLIALVLLLANISASATETSGTTEDNGAFPVGDLDMARYSTMLMTASEGGMLGEDLTYPCGTDNTYCQYIENVMPTMTAMEIYEYLTALYNDEEGYFEFIALMLHYGIYHLDDGLVCICQVPMVEPEEYPVGDLSAHTEDTCPWKYENLSVAEKVAVIEGCDTDEEKAAYFDETVTNSKTKAEMDAYAAVYGKIDITSTVLISLYDEEILAEYNSETGILTDVRYHIPVAKVVEGKVYPLSSEATTDDETNAE